MSATAWTICINILAGGAGAGTLVVWWSARRWPGHPRIALLLSLYFCWIALFTGMVTCRAWTHDSGLFDRIWNPLVCAYALYMAQKNWDDWNRARRGRPLRTWGRIALRLGRLIIVPGAPRRTP